MTSITSINQIPSNYHCHRRIYKLVWGDKTKLYGEVEVDESYFGKQKYGKQRLVIGAIERHTRQIRLQLIYDRSRISCERFIQRSVCSGSLVATDGLDSYNELRYLGYDWTSCNHNVGIFGPTNQIECLWSVLKRHIRRVHRVLAFSHRELGLILKEWEVRHNRPELFYNVDNYFFTCSGLLH